MCPQVPGMEPGERCLPGGRVREVRRQQLSISFSDQSKIYSKPWNFVFYGELIFIFIKELQSSFYIPQSHTMSFFRLRVWNELILHIEIQNALAATDRYVDNGVRDESRSMFECVLDKR